MPRRPTRSGALLVASFVASLLAVGAAPASAGSPADGGAVDHWSPERVAAAEPRDLVVDGRGLGYLRSRDGSLTPHGHTVAARHTPLRSVPNRSATAAPRAKPSGGSDTTPPVISDLDPDGTTIGASYSFTATVVDPGSGVRSVTVEITFPGGTQTQSFTASALGGDMWGVTLQGFTDGAWSWRVIAQDAARRGGNTATSASTPFTVSTTGGGGGGGGSDVTANAEWSTGGAVQTVAGRIYFEMPSNRRHTRWSGYVCSGSVATDSTSGRSIILTAAHCVYDDAYKSFARNVLFIPNQAGTSGSATDLNCDNDPLGCWEASIGVVDADWANRKFPDNIPWDYGYYVVSDNGAHVGTSTSSDALDVAAGSLGVQFSAPSVGSVTHALGYSYADDPKLMYCAEAMGTEGSANWWLPSCLLSGGSSGGPWVQPMSTASGSGPIISVNSWGYSGSPGMAGPKLSGSSASCLFTASKTASLTGGGVIPSAC